MTINLQGDPTAYADKTFSEAPCTSNQPALRTLYSRLYDFACSWSLTLREEHRLRVFMNRVLRRIYVPRRD
jgi:hypothetical protein